MKKKATPTKPATPISRRTRILFGCAMVALPLVLLLAVEGALRVAGYGGYDRMLKKAGQVEGGTLVISDQAGAISYFFANRSRPGYNEQYNFLTPKPKGVFRIFLVGESAAKGYPEPRNLASSAFLEKMLTDAWPERKVEVINLGTTAVASFPVLGMLTEALEFEPDLVIIHTGHNEFFGAYGVSSISRGGTSRFRLKATRFVRSLALVQFASRHWQSEESLKGKTLMEIMAAQTYTAPDSPLREAAARNLGGNVAEMLKRCRARGVPAIVCTLPSNERDLFPVGEDRLDGLNAQGAVGRARETPYVVSYNGKSGFAENQRRFPSLLEAGAAQLPGNPQSAETNLTEALALAPTHARAHFLHGRALYVLGRTNEARAEFVAARDFDSMPWRATSVQEKALREATAAEGGVLCEMQNDFREQSPGGCIGWELMDDHVHPTLRGQALMAEAIVKTMRRLQGPAAITDAQSVRIKPWEEYSRALGDNPYDRYGVDYTMFVLFNVEFMREQNPEGRERFAQHASAFEAGLAPEVTAVLNEWKSETPHAGGKRPITGMVARQFMRDKKFEEALKLFQIAQTSVPEYTSWHMEYVYFALACREKLAGKLSEPERKKALEEIEQGEFLLAHGFSQTGLTERYTGRLYQLRGEYREAIPFLNASRQKLSGFDLVAADEALFTSLVETGQETEARKLAENGVAHSGQYASFYKQMLALLEQRNRSKSSDKSPNSP
jgi:tetratricopeptide (TPR) repeat protein